MVLSNGAQLIGKYTIEKKIGEGGFGIVYLAKERLSGKIFAIKEYYAGQFCRRSSNGKVQLKQKDEFHQTMFYKGLERFGKEARSLHKMNHENIIKVTDYFEENNTAYMVMEYIKGLSVEDFLKRQNVFTPEQADRILMPIIDAIRYIHSFEDGIIHRDIKPGNILIDLAQGKPILIDFGTTMGVDEVGATAFASVGYSAIEQSADSLSDMQGFHTDIYALAATFHHCLTGKKPLDASHRMLNADVVNLSESLAGKFDPRLLKLIDLGLILRPESRPQSIGELLELAGYETKKEEPVRTAEGQVEGESKDGARPQSIPKSNERNNMALYALIAFIILGLGGYGAFEYFGNVPLTNKKVYLDIQPTNANVKFNDSELSGGAKYYLIQPGRAYKFEISLVDYESVEFNLVLDADGNLHIPSALRRGVDKVELVNNEQLKIALKNKLYEFALSSDSPDVEFIVEGIPKYYPGIQLAAGDYNVTARSEKYNKTISRTIQLSGLAGNDDKHEFNFAAENRAVELRILPSNVVASVEFIGEEQQPQAPYNLEPRSYQVRVSAKGYESRQVVLNVANQTDFTVTLKPERWVAVQPKVEQSLPADVLYLQNNMVTIEGNQMTLGCNKEDDCDVDERPSIKVDIKAFQISNIEINNGAWAQCYKAKKCNNKGSSDEDPNLPITNVSFKDVHQFINWINVITKEYYTLPSEAQWEAAASKVLANGSAQLCDFSNFADKSSPYPWRFEGCSDGVADKPDDVKATKPIEGLYHLLGNVWEMTATCWDETNILSKSASCLQPTVKGGAYNSTMFKLRPSYRSLVNAEDKDSNLGFRLVRGLQ